METRYFTYPEEEQDSDQNNGIDRLPQRELSSISPLVITVLQRILLQPLWGHDCGAGVFNKRQKST